MWNKVTSKDRPSSTLIGNAEISINDPLTIIVPTECCSRLIGKNGVTIKKLQSDSGARTNIETEEAMKANHSYGRRINITGTFPQKCHAVYLILRILTVEENFPSSWRGHTPPV